MHPFAIFSLQEVNFSIYCMKEILKQSINKNSGQMTEFLREVKKIEGDIVTSIFCIDKTEVLGKQRTLSRNSDTGEFSSRLGHTERFAVPHAFLLFFKTGCGAVLVECRDPESDGTWSRTKKKKSVFTKTLLPCCQYRDIIS